MKEKRAKGKGFMHWKLLAAAALALLAAGCGVSNTVAPRAVPIGQPDKLIPAPPETHPAPAKK